MLYVMEGKKRRKAVEVVCEQCSKEFLKQERFVKKRKHHFCCSECSSLFSRKRVDVICAVCYKKKELSQSKYDVCKSKTFFCSRKCQNIGQSANSDVDYLCNWKDGASSYRTRALDKYGKKCNECGYDEHEIALDVHHIDRNRDNNEIENLVVLCSRCHRLVTFNII